MPKKLKFVPVMPLTEDVMHGIIVRHISSNNLDAFHHAFDSHRHDYHFMLLVERGEADFEIDFEKYKIQANSILHIHPSQVHRVVTASNLDFYLIGISNEALHPQYSKLFEGDFPGMPLQLNEDCFQVLLQAASLCCHIFEGDYLTLQTSALRDSCNALTALILSHYLKFKIKKDAGSRLQFLTDSFKMILDRDFTLIKQPSDYANALNVSTSYLNECVKSVTGMSVSKHIQLRNILEAKRLICHSSKSLKEIASELGYFDSAYFSRLFKKVVGMTGVEFRKQYRD